MANKSQISPASLLEAVRHASDVRFTPPLFLKIPEELVRWLVEDLSPQHVATILSNPVFQDRIKGYRAHNFPRHRAVSLLCDEFKNETPFRDYLAALWLKQRQNEIGSLNRLSVQQIIQRRRDLVSKHGFQLLYWCCIYSEPLGLQKLAPKLAKEFPTFQPASPHAVRQEGATIVPQGIGSPPNTAKGNGKPDQLERELEEVQLMNAELEHRLEAEKGFCKKLESEILSLKAALRQAEKGSQAEKDRMKNLEENAATLQSKIASLSSASQAIHAQEKSNRALEHDLRSSRSAADEMRQKLEALSRERDQISARSLEAKSQISILHSLLSRLASVDPFSANRIQKLQSGQALLVLGSQPQIPGEYYKLASSRGLSLLYHPGFQRDAALEKMLLKCSQAFLLLPSWENIFDHEDLAGFMRKNQVPFTVLPHLTPQAFGALVEVF